MTQRDELTAAIEFQSAVLVRNLEMVRRRSDFYQEVDRAGYLLLRTLAEHGPAEIGTLSGLLGLDPSTVGRQVNAIAADGLVTKDPDPSDRRRAVVTPTDRGLRALEAVRRRRLVGTDTMLADWSEQDLRRAAEILTRYNAAIAVHHLGEPAVAREPN